MTITFPCVRIPTKAGTRNPGIVAAMLVIPISTPEKSTLKDSYALQGCLCVPIRIEGADSGTLCLDLPISENMLFH
jgi:hypothetical protein